MEIILLGTGTAVPISGHTPSAILLKSKDLTALLDMGPGATYKVAGQGVDPFHLQYLFLTHLHSDHTLDLVTFLQMNASTPDIERTSSVFLTGCRGLKNLYNGLMRLYPGIAPGSYKLYLREIVEDRFEVNGVVVSSTLSGHTTDSICYRFDTSEGSVVYTGDCATVAPLDQFCAGVDLLICECSFPAGWPTSDHMSADSVGKLAAQAGVKTLIVTHLYPPAVKVDLQSQIQEYYTGPVIIAQDNYKFLLP